MRWLVLFLVFLSLLILLPLSFFTVDRTQFVYLTQFGRHLATFDGGNDDDAGLHFKLPWNSVVRLDRRLHYFDLPGAELLTRDPRGNTIDRTVTVDAYVCWRIAGSDQVDRFLRTVGTTEGAQTLLTQRITSELGAAISELELDDLISDKTEGIDAEGKPRRKIDDKREALREQLLNRGSPPLRQAALSEYGIELIDIRLRRLNHPPAVRQAIFERIVSERKKKAADYQTEGERKAADILSASERQVKEEIAKAEAQALRLRGQADAEADRIRGEAQAKDPEFYSFLKKLEEYQRIMGDNKTTLLLSTHREMFDTLFQPPTSKKGDGSK